MLYMGLFFEINENIKMIALVMTNLIITNPLLQFVLIANIQTLIMIALIKICINIF